MTTKTVYNVCCTHCVYTHVFTIAVNFSTYEWFKNYCIHKTQVWAALWITVYEKSTYKLQNVILCLEAGEKMKGI